MYHQIIDTVTTGAHTVIHGRIKRGATRGDSHGHDANHYRDKALKLVNLDDMRGIQREVRVMCFV